MTILLNQQARPFVKWAGGKAQLISQMQRYLPQELVSPGGKIKKYYEPFLGGGAVFFWLSNQFEFENVYLYEINKQVVNCYRTIKNRSQRLIEELKEIEFEYFSFDDEEKERFYYVRREEFNGHITSGIKNHGLRRAALLIFLNKTCFNGLYRVNSRGEFNVPFGRYKKPAICDERNILAVKDALKNAEIIQGDFALCLEHADAESFVYFDPPYRPLSKTASFTNYSKNNFDDREQYRLKDVFDKLNARGAKVMLSNSDPKNYNKSDDFFDDLYAEYHIKRLKATRMINCNADKRGEIREILVMNY